MATFITSILGFGNSEMLLIVLSIIFFVMVIWTISDLMSNKTLEMLPKLVWLAIIIFFPFFGTLFYLYYGRTEEHLSSKQ